MRRLPPALFPLLLLLLASLPPAAAQAPAPAWEAQVEGAVPAVPVHAGGVFAVPSTADRIVAFDARDGGLRWQAMLDGDASGAADAAGLVVSAGFDGVVRAHRVADGSTAWSHDAGAMVTSPPVASQGRLFVVHKAGGVLGLDARTGGLLWSADAPGAFGSPAAADGLVVVGTQEGALLAFAAADGRPAWQADLAGPAARAVAAAGGRFFVTAAPGTVAAYGPDGTRHWHLDDLPGASEATPVPDEDRLYLHLPSGVLAAFDAATGAPVWERVTSAPGGDGGGRGPVPDLPPFVSDAGLDVATHDGRLLGLDPATGDLRWELPLDAPSATAPARGGGMLVATTTAGKVLAFRVAPSANATADDAPPKREAPAPAAPLAVLALLGAARAAGATFKPRSGRPSA